MPDTDSREFSKCSAHREAQIWICLYTYWFLAAVSFMEARRTVPQSLTSSLALAVIDAICVWALALWQCIRIWFFIQVRISDSEYPLSPIQPCYLQPRSVTTCFLLSLRKTVLILYSYHLYREWSHVKCFPCYYSILHAVLILITYTDYSFVIGISKIYRESNTPLDNSRWDS